MFNFLWYPQRKRGRDGPNRTLITENQRLRQTMHLNGCAAVQCSSRVSSHNPCGLHACTCLACGTLAGFLLPMAVVFEFPCWTCLCSCGRCAGNLGFQFLLLERPRERSFNLIQHTHTHQHHTLAQTHDLFAHTRTNTLRRHNRHTHPLHTTTRTKLPQFYVRSEVDNHGYGSPTAPHEMSVHGELTTRCHFTETPPSHYCVFQSDQSFIRTWFDARTRCDAGFSPTE